MKGFGKSNRLDRNSKGGEKMLLIYLAFVCRNKFNRSFLYLEINIQKIKWLLCCSYNLNKNNIHVHLENLERSLSLYS